MKDIKKVTYPKYFYTLDIVRGFAALSVVLWHWQHFYYHGSIFPPDFSRHQQPLYSWFFIFYDNGLLAVDFFFCLSGFIFFCMYGETIRNKQITFREFGYLRLSRLYPLHALSLVLVAVLQIINYHYFDSFQVYKYNDFYHLVLNLFFIQSWGFEHGESFNGPGWSVSVEVLLYLIFFVIFYFRLNGKFTYIILILLAMFLQPQYQPLGRGIFSFFLGGLTFLLFKKVIASQRVQVVIRIVGIICFLLWLLVVIESKTSFVEHQLARLHFNFLTSLHTDQLVKIKNFFVRSLVFPLTLLLLALSEIYTHKIGRRFAFIGHLSYSSYLLHFPLQLICLLLLPALGLSRSCFNSGYALIGFFAVLVGICFISFKYFEIPCQKSLRRLLLINGRVKQNRS